jgi:hypothetical protein
MEEPFARAGELAGMALTIIGVSSVVLERRCDANGVIERLPPGGILLALGGSALLFL